MSSHPDYEHVRVVSSLPRAPEHALSDWVQRVPWLGISIAAHLVLFSILMITPWRLLIEEAPKTIAASIERPPARSFEEPPREEQEELAVQPVEEPVLADTELAPRDAADEVTDVSALASTQGEQLFTDSTLDDKALNDVIGLGGAAGGKFGNRFAAEKRNELSGGSGTEAALRDGLEWLVQHQSPDGSWDCDGFDKYCGKIGADTCDGVGESNYDVGMTGLALLAFLGDGNTTRTGPYKEVVARGIAWLKAQQDPNTGLIGPQVGHAFIYNHAIATLALCEAYYFSKSPQIKRTAQGAVDFITRARNPYSAWRYAYPPNGENDTSVTGWMVFALKSAEDGGLQLNKEAYAGALSWFDAVTEPGTGRAGYDKIGSSSSRRPGKNDRYSTEAGESMTAVALLCRFFMGQVPSEEPIMLKHADLMRMKLPEWDPSGLRNDMYYWYYGSYAMFQMGGSKYWEPWNKALKRAVLDSQRHDGDEKGSWDPKDAWGYSGGRVYSTALMVLCLEVYYRYSQILGAR